MGAKTAISVAEYLRTSYPGLDREYRDGEVLERSMPDNLHSATQFLFLAFLAIVRKTIALHPRPELRLRLRPGVFRIPDICVFHPDAPKESVPSTPPFIAIEILSPDDRMSDVTTKLEEYRAFGVPHVWLVDPHGKRMYTCDAGLAEVPELTIPELGITVTPADIFE